MIYVRNIFFYITFYIWTIIFFITFSPVKFFTKKFALHLSKIWTGMVILLTEQILGISYEISGKRIRLRDKSILIASNHQSPWETFFFVVFFDNPVFILKKELKIIPIMSWYFEKLDFIFIDRTKKLNSIKHIINSAKQIMKNENKTFIIFPEGTRILPGKKVALNSGVFAIHKMLSLPVFPLKHNSGLFWKNKRFLKYPGKIKVSIFPQIKSKKKDSFLKKIEKYFYN